MTSCDAALSNAVSISGGGVTTLNANANLTANCPVIKPDTVTKSLKCATCPDTICATANDLPASSELTTYKSCGLSTNKVSPAVYSIYHYERNFIVNNIPTKIVGASTTNVVSSQQGGGTDLTYGGVNWAKIATGIAPDASGKISITYSPDATTTTGSGYLSADAMLVSDGVNTYVIDNNGAGYSQVGAWTSQVVGGAYNINENYIGQPFVGKTATWSFTSLPTTTSVASGTQKIDPITGCLVYTPDGTLAKGDTVKSCVIACRNGLCDTTFINIVPPGLKPDTVYKKLKCLTCPDTTCATADDLPAGAGAITYKSCASTIDTAIYQVYQFNRLGVGTNSTNAPYTITGSSTTNVVLNQSKWALNYPHTFRFLM